MDIEVPLNRLRFGHEEGEGINARVTGRTEGIAALAANLHARGQIENLVVKACDDGTYAVANGNRRLAAFHMIYGEQSDVPIKVTVRDVDNAGAFEDSLTTAVLAQQLHPVDQYEAFARLEERGKTHEEIAHQYGLTEKQVRQALALGRLAPAIRAAWRGGEIKAEVAQAFTLALDHKTQEKLFLKLEKAGHLYQHMIQRELGVADRDIGRLIRFAGEEYCAAGGGLVKDLFGEAHIVSDPALLKMVANDKLLAECDRLKAEGWSWAELESTLPQGARFWPKSTPKALVYEGDEEARLKKLREDLEQYEEAEEWSYEREQELTTAIDAIEAAVEARSFTDRQKAKSGCIVGLNDGELTILAGVNRPEVGKGKTKASTANDDDDDDAPAAGGKATKAAEPETATISNALLQRLSVQLTLGAATALAQDIELSLIVLLAGIAHKYSGEAVRVSVSGLDAQKLDLTGTKEIADNITLLRKMSLQDRMALLGPIAAASLTFAHTLDQDRDDTRDSVRAVCNAIDAAALNAGLRGAFDAKDYFASVPKAVAIEAIREAMGEDIARQQAKGGKAEIVEFALANVPATGWLPVQLRAAGYDGPPVVKAISAAVPEAPPDRKRGKAGTKGATKTGGKAGGKTPAKASAARGGAGAKASPKKPVKRAAAAKKAAKKTGKR